MFKMTKGEVFITPSAGEFVTYDTSNGDLKFGRVLAVIPNYSADGSPLMRVYRSKYAAPFATAEEERGSYKVRVSAGIDGVAYLDKSRLSSAINSFVETALSSLQYNQTAKPEGDGNEVGIPVKCWGVYRTHLPEGEAEKVKLWSLGIQDACSRLLEFLCEKGMGDARVDFWVDLYRSDPPIYCVMVSEGCDGGGEDVYYAESTSPELTVNHLMVGIGEHLPPAAAEEKAVVTPDLTKNLSAAMLSLDELRENIQENSYSNVSFSLNVTLSGVYLLWADGAELCISGSDFVAACEQMVSDLTGEDNIPF